jgi:hypothetical protein
MSGADQVVGLAAAIEALRAELASAVEQGSGRGMRFRIEPVDISMQVVVTRSADGRIGWGPLGVGGSYDAATTQTLRLRLQPVWEQADGTVLEDFTIADEELGPEA